VLGALKRHPFGIEAFFRSSLVLTYAVPKAALADFVDPGLELDTYEDWGFLAIAMVETQQLRPRGFPKWLGRDFFLSGYRIFTRFVRPGQPTLRGLRILRSDTDRRSMVRLGNVFTHYSYRLAEVRATLENGRYEVVVRTPGREADVHVVADLASRPAALPATSPFRTMEEARSFAGPLPFTFSFDQKLQKMVVIKGLRTAWDPQPIHVDVREASFLEQPRFADARLANAFYLESTPYRWKAGTLEPLA
jgi:hypothetical protein